MSLLWDETKLEGDNLNFHNITSNLVVVLSFLVCIVAGLVFNNAA